MHTTSIVRESLWSQIGSALRSVVGAILVVGFTGVNSAQAAERRDGPGFDCSKAATTGERLICSDPGLSHADQRLLTLYQQLRTALTEADRRKLVDEQREWIRERDLGCGVANSIVILPSLRSRYVACLREAYLARVTTLMTDLASAGVLLPKVPEHPTQPIYRERDWKISDAVYVGRISAMSLADARRQYIGRQQKFSRGWADGPFLSCPSGGREVNQQFKSDAAAISDPSLKSDWLEPDVRLNGSGLFILSMRCGTPGTRSYGQVEFVQLGDNSAAYFALDGILFRAMPAS